MAKVPGKKEAPQEPQIHRIALPVSDESLVIDLPDGQKLVVGKMATGSVIEVATWRGTGRPDSRTTRLMLGMSSATAAEESNADGTGQDSSTPQKAIAPYIAKVQALIAGLKKPNLEEKLAPESFDAAADASDIGEEFFPASTSVAAVTPTLESEDVSKKSRRERRSLWTPPTPEDSTSGEADKWLEEILARAAAKDSSKTSTPSATKKTATKKTATKKTATKKSPPAAKKATASKTAAKKPGRTR